MGYLSWGGFKKMLLAYVSVNIYTLEAEVMQR